MAERATTCQKCGRQLPKRAHSAVCATCRKREQGVADTWTMKEKPTGKKPAGKE